MRQAQFTATDINSPAPAHRSLRRGKAMLGKILTAILDSMCESRQRQAMRIISDYQRLTLSRGRGIDADRNAPSGAGPDVDH